MIEASKDLRNAMEAVASLKYLRDKLKQQEPEHEAEVSDQKKAMGEKYMRGEGMNGDLIVKRATRLCILLSGQESIFMMLAH